MGCTCTFLILFCVGVELSSVHCQKTERLDRTCFCHVFNVASSGLRKMFFIYINPIDDIRVVSVLCSEVLNRTRCIAADGITTILVMADVGAMCSSLMFRTNMNVTDVISLGAKMLVWLSYFILV